MVYCYYDGYFDRFTTNEVYTYWTNITKEKIEQLELIDISDDDQNYFLLIKCFKDENDMNVFLTLKELQNN
jgi:hypothetical protein